MTQATKERLLAFALPEIPASGFSDATLKVAAERAGVSISEIRRHFPRGAESLVEAFSEWADARMRDAVVKAGIPRLRDRITLAVRARLEAMEGHREAARRAAAYLALPQNAPLAARLFFTTVDAMWRAAGDKSSDFNYYTKRALLAGVYGSTLLNWLSDASEGRKDSWAFLDARIDDVMNIQKARGELENRLASMPNPLDLLAGFTRPNGPR
jgi:ubiquinone biosynthesis protein COQ9